MSGAICRLSLVRELECLIKSIDELNQYLQSASASVYQSSFDATRAVQQAYETIHYDCSQIDGRHVFHLPGAVLIERSGKLLVDAVNEHKKKFSIAVEQYKIRIMEEQSCGVMTALSKVREELAAHGFGRIHLKCAYREIVVIDENVHRIRWYWEHGGWGKQKTMLPSEALDVAREKFKDEPVTIESIERLLNSIPPDEPIAQRHKMPQVLKVTYTSQNKKQITRVGSLPIVLIKMRCSQKISDFNLEYCLDSSLAKSINGKRNSKFEENCLIDALSIYRYKQEYRAAAKEKYCSSLAIRSGLSLQP
ncbi:TPA: hypothetical protein I7117_14825 [Vibrio vulnificus]|nr:hypothetical protein [Vibrio vulnificus]